MNKTELVAAVAAKAGISKKDADAAVAAVFASVTDALANGDKVQLIGFGTFEVRARSEKTARNPRTGETMTVPATKVPFFIKANSICSLLKYLSVPLLSSIKFHLLQKDGLKGLCRSTRR